MTIHNIGNTQAVDLCLKDLSILVVDDVYDARHFLSAYLQRKGATIYAADNGDSGLQLFKQQRPDIVITDIRMTQMNGIAMAEAIHNLEAETPIIFVTAYNETEPMQQCIGIGATEYLIKPITQERLQLALQKACHKHQLQRQIRSKIDTLSHELDKLQHEKHSLSETILHLIGDDRHVAVDVLRRGQDIISGDFHCVVQYQDCLYALLGDGMGHGLSAILPALDLPKQFRHLASKGFSLSRIADELNQILFACELRNHFVAATLMRIDAERGLIEVINCGNPEALLIDDQGKLLHRFRSNHVAWGILSGDCFIPEVQIYHYQTPVKLYICSDGFTETLEMLPKTAGIETFADILNAQSDGVLRYLDHCLQTLPPDRILDDITLLEITVPSIGQQTIAGLAPIARQAIEKHCSLDKLSILLVDDPETHKSLGRFLSRKVGMLYAAHNDHDGLQLFINHRPSLIIADISVPTMNGLEMVKRIRSIDPNVPIILTSDQDNWNSSHDKLETLLDLTVNKFLPKPLAPEKLLEAIQSCCDKYNYLTNLHLSASLFMMSPLAMTVTDADRNITAVNPAFARITGYSEEDVIGCNPRILSSGKHDSAFYTQMWECIDKRGQWSGEIWNRRKNGEFFLEWINIMAIYDQAGKISHYASIFSDMTQRTHAEEKIRHFAHHDPLTKLPNRTLFFDRLEQALLQMQRDQGKLAVIYLDVDYFKIINDTLGHSVGDALICALSQTLQSILRASDTVCRLGGDEFAILLLNVESMENITRLANKIFNAISKTYRVAGKELRVGISMGISQYPRDGSDAETLLKRADNAMYQAKKKGRNRYQFFKSGHEQQAERQMLIHQNLHHALEHGEFYLHYQPKYALDEQRIVGAEALLRWKHTELGELSPVEFIPIAEETGFIIELGEWLIEQACRDLADWKALGAEVVPIAVNISPLQFHRGNLQRSLLQSLTDHHLQAALLQIELTEGVVMNSQKSTLKHLQAIKDLGVAISIDDFGTGYSSLSYLRKLPIDELKIDRSFIMEIIDEASLLDSRLTAIPSTIIELAKKLKLKLVAEGVETVIQRNFLQQQGCQIIQGYLFSRPVNKESMLGLLSNTKHLLQ